MSYLSFTHRPNFFKIWVVVQRNGQNLHACCLCYTSPGHSALCNLNLNLNVTVCS